MFRAILPLCLAAALPAPSQSVPDLHPRTLPIPAPAPSGAVKEPTVPPARTVQDSRTQVSFSLPAGWNLSRSDGELSTFHLDARSAPPRAEVRAVANLAFNPYPRSTFSGALFYLSQTSHSTPNECIAQASAKPNAALGSAVVGDVPFSRGHDAHGKICTEARDTVYTAFRHGACVRFDLVLNNFCGGEVSGAQDLTGAQMQNLEQRLESILETVRFTAK
jgi:hypothetical protein